MIWGRAVVAMLALSVCLDGCGASNSGGTLPRPALLSLANAICTTASSAGKTIKPLADIRTVTAAAAYLNRIAPISARETRSLQALSPASDVKPPWDAFISEQVAANQLLQSLEAKAEHHDPSVRGSLRQVGPASQAVFDAASALGAKACAH
jgi:hypothetical protein